MGMANGMNQLTPAQFQAMRGTQMRPVNLPQHLQQAQQQVAEHSLQQQHAAQAQAQAQHQQVRNCVDLFYHPKCNSLHLLTVISINNNS